MMGVSDVKEVEMRALEAQKTGSALGGLTNEKADSRTLNCSRKW